MKGITAVLSFVVITCMVVGCERASTPLSPNASAGVTAAQSEIKATTRYVFTKIPVQVLDHTITPGTDVQAFVFSLDTTQSKDQALVAAVQAARARQESDAAALVARAQEIAGRRAQFAQVLQRMAGLGQSAKEVQALLQEGPGRLDEVQVRMQQVAEDATAIGREALEKEMEDVARQAESVRQQVLSALNRLSLLAKKG